MHPDLRSSLRPYLTRAVVAAVAEGVGVLAACWGLAALLAVTLGGAPEPSRLANALVALFSVLGGVLGLGVGIYRVVSTAAGPRKLALHLERMVPELHDAVRAAVGVSLEPGASGGSNALQQAHVRATSHTLRQAHLQTGHRQTLARRGRLLHLMGGAGLLVMAAVMVLAPARLETGLGRALLRGAVLEGRAAALPPLWSDVSALLTFPAYMKQEPRLLDGISGDISAPKGTEVLLRARADRAVQSARLILGSGDVPLTVAEGRNLSGQFTVQDGGRYRLALVDSHGDEVVEQDGHTITVEPDLAPTVELLEPGEDRTVSLDERLGISFKGRDDHGLTEFNLVVRNLRKGGEPVRKSLSELTDEPTEHAGGGGLDLRSLEARPGDRLVISVEAKDNDTVSGPKTGVSVNRTLKVFSAAEHHSELIAKQEELMQRMVIQLADEMETPLDPPDEGSPATPDQEAERWLAQVKRGQGLGEALQGLADEFAKDELAPAEVTRALRNIRVDLMRTYDELAVLAAEIRHQVRETSRFPEPYAQRSVRLGKTAADKLGQHILYMDDLLGRQRLQEAQEAAKELAATQARLRDLLSEYAKAGDEETRKRIMEEISALREQLRQLGEKLAQLQREIPQEYMNTDALDAKNLTDPLKDIDEMLAEGDIEGAAKALEQMAQRTRQLMDEMEKGEQEYGGEEYAELREKLDAFKSELDEITQEQEALLKESKERLEKARERARKDLGEDVEQFAARVAQEAEALAKELQQMGQGGLIEMENEQREEAEARASETAKALRARDFEEAQRAARQAVGALEWLRSSLMDRTESRFAAGGPGAKRAKEKTEQSLPRAQKIMEDLDRLMPDPSQKMTAKEREAMREQARRQGKLGERARQLSQDMENIGKELPLFGPEHRETLEGARRSMQGAQADLGSQDLPAATGRQREALARMQELQRAMEQAGKGGSGGGGVPTPFGSSSDGQGQRVGGQRNNKERVEIPGAENFKVPEQFRKDILDAMKEQPPSRFQPEVKQYYEELVK
ncbi:MAG: DUF4175 family protein [Myxococcota bacterium]